MELNIETLTQEQRKQLDMWYNIYLNEDNKLITEEPIEITTEFIEHKSKEIEQTFQNTVRQFSAWYSQAEIDSWDIKEAEAKIVDWGGSSEFLTDLLISWETVEELATKVLNNATTYRLAFAKAEQVKRQALKDLEV